MLLAKCGPVLYIVSSSAHWTEQVRPAVFYSYDEWEDPSVYLFRGKWEKICFSDILARMEECVYGLSGSGNPPCIPVSETNLSLFSC